MHDLRSWLQEVERLGNLKRVQGADPNLEIGIITELNCRRKGPALLFDAFPVSRKAGESSPEQFLTRRVWD